MRVSMNFYNPLSPSGITRVAHIYLDGDELPGVRAVKFDGTLATGLIVEDDGNMRRGENHAITPNGTCRVCRIPADRLGAQPPGRTRIPKGVSILDKTNTTIAMDKVVFLPEELMPAPRGSQRTRTKPFDGITPMQGFRTEDGEFFATEAEAREHVGVLTRRKVLNAMQDQTISQVLENSDKWLHIVFQSGASFDISCHSGHLEYELETYDGSRVHIPAAVNWKESK